MENILLDTIMMRSIKPARDTMSAPIVDEKIVDGKPGDIVDPDTGEVVDFDSYVKKENLPDETLISSDDFNSIFGE